MSVPDQLNGSGIYLICGGIVLIIAVICVIFLVRAWRAGSPYVMTGATDARFYEEICDNVVRFVPVIYGPEQMKGMHGLNENIEISCLPGAVDFYRNLIRANVC